MIRLLFVVLLAVAITTVTEARAEESPERALALHDEAKALYAQGKYREAVEKLRLAVELDPDATVLYYNLGLIEEKLGNIDSALTYFRHCLNLETSPEEKRDIEQTIKRLEGAKQDVTFGDRVQAPIIIRRSDTGSAEEEGLPALLLWAYVAGGTAVAAAIVGTVLAARASEVEPGDAPSTEPGVTPDDLQKQADEAHSLAIGADIAFAVAGSALATTIVLALIGAHDPGTEQTAELRVGPLGGQCVLRF